MEMPEPAPFVRVRHDGRRARAEANRERIVAAVVALVGRGELTPTAEAIAAEAHVSLRTVFRHFDDMETLYLEIAGLIMARAQPVIDRPFPHLPWRETVGEIVRRRSELFERVAPFKRALDMFRHRSAALAEASARLAALSRAVLEKRLGGWALPAETVEAIDLLTSLESWMRLRDTQKLSCDEACRVLETVLVALSPQPDEATADR